MGEKASNGRPARYDTETAEAICVRLADGESLRSICLDESMPARTTVQKWILEDTNGFASQYARAREMQAETFADELIDIADDGSNDWVERKNKRGELEIVLDREHIARSDLRVSTRKWVMARILPKKYGDKQPQNDPDEGNEVRIVGGLPD